MPNIADRIRVLDDFQMVRFFDRFSRRLIAGTTVSLDEIRVGIPDVTRALEGFTDLENMTPERAERSLEPSISAVVARSILLKLAYDSDFGPLIERALETYRDEALVASATLARGLVASVLLIIATTEFRAKGPNWEFVKKGADPQLVKAVTEVCVKAIPAR